MPTTVSFLFHIFIVSGYKKKMMAKDEVIRIHLDKTSFCGGGGGGGGGRVVRWCWVNFQFRGVLLF